MSHSRVVWVADVTDRRTLARLIRTALAHDVARVPLERPPHEPGDHTLQLRIAGAPVVVLNASLEGAGSNGWFPLLLAPLDPSHVAELQAIIDADARESLPPPSGGPMSATASASLRHEPPLLGREPASSRASSASPSSSSSMRHRPHAVTLPDPEPELVDSAELEPSVDFDPEAAIISRAPVDFDPQHAVHPAERREDTLTLPHSVSIPPPITEAAPASSAASILARGMKRTTSAPFSAVAPTERTEIMHPADDESISVVFGNEPTVPGSAAPSHRDPLQVVTEDSDTFPTSSSRPYDARATQRELVSPEDPRRTYRQVSAPDPRRTEPALSEVASSGRTGPRTMKRVTGQMIVAGRVIANRYRIEQLVGAGAVGAVYRATHVDLPRTFAIKVLHPHYRADPMLMASFRAEARAASLLDHPNVTVVHDFGEDPGGLVYIVMEYLQGENLQAILDRDRRLAPGRAIDIMMQVCGALSAAHERGIVHRDVKPDNIMLVPTRDDEGRTYELVKVCDFGIAALETAPDDDGGEITAGTPEYMAPEQAGGRADQRTDVYACGIVLYEMLLGGPPFVGESPVATLTKHAMEAPRRPSDIEPGFPVALESIILRAIEKSPERRFPTMRELRAALKSVSRLDW